MATKNIGFVTVDPGSGTGNGSISVSASVHTGRADRSLSGNITIKTTNSTVTKTVSVTQKAAAEFLTITSDSSSKGTTSSNPLNGEAGTGKTMTLTISGESNSKILKPSGTGLTFSNFKVTPSGGSATAVTGSSGNYEPSGDPGSTAKYTWQVDVTVPENTTVSAKTFTFSINNSTGSLTAATKTIYQAAGVERLSDPTPNSITFNAEGFVMNGTTATTNKSQTVTFTSNTGWTVS